VPKKAIPVTYQCKQRFEQATARIATTAKAILITLKIGDIKMNLYLLHPLLRTLSLIIYTTRQKSIYTSGGREHAQKEEIATAMTCASLCEMLTVVSLTPALEAAAFASPWSYENMLAKTRSVRGRADQ
jgi:hypothetical protein